MTTPVINSGQSTGGNASSNSNGNSSDAVAYPINAWHVLICLALGLVCLTIVGATEHWLIPIARTVGDRHTRDDLDRTLAVYRARQTQLEQILASIRQESGDPATTPERRPSVTAVNMRTGADAFDAKAVAPAGAQTKWVYYGGPTSPISVGDRLTSDELGRYHDAAVREQYELERRARELGARIASLPHGEQDAWAEQILSAGTYAHSSYHLANILFMLVGYSCIAAALILVAGGLAGLSSADMHGAVSDWLKSHAGGAAAWAAVGAAVVAGGTAASVQGLPEAAFPNAIEARTSPPPAPTSAGRDGAVVDDIKPPGQGFSDGRTVFLSPTSNWYGDSVYQNTSVAVSLQEIAAQVRQANTRNMNLTVARDPELKQALKDLRQEISNQISIHDQKVTTVQIDTTQFQNLSASLSALDDTATRVIGTQADLLDAVKQQTISVTDAMRINTQVTRELSPTIGTIHTDTGCSVQQQQALTRRNGLRRVANWFTGWGTDCSPAASPRGAQPTAGRAPER